MISVWGKRALFIASGFLLGAGSMASAYEAAAFNGHYHESVETKIDLPFSVTALHDYSLSEMTLEYYTKLLELRKATLLSTTNYHDYDRDGELDSVSYSPRIILSLLNYRSETYTKLEDGSISCSVGYNMTDSFREGVIFPSEQEKREYFNEASREFRKQMTRFK